MASHIDKTIRVAVVDDHPVVCDGIRSLLQRYSDVELVGVADSSEPAMRLLRETMPDVLLLDIRLGPEDGFRLARHIIDEGMSCRIMFLSSFEDDEYLAEAARVGAYGYLLKNAPPEMLVQAIRDVSRGERRLSPTLAGKAFGQLQEQAQASARTAAGMTAGEVDVLRLLAAGKSNPDIAIALNYSERTVKRRVNSILLKLGAANRTEAVAIGIERRLI